MPVAEESGLVLPVGRWVMETACAQMRDWSEGGVGVPWVTANLWGNQVLQEDFVERVQGVMQASGVPPGGLALEVNEMTLMRNPGEILEKLARLRQHDIRVALDDFGTGYSSMSYLRNLPVDCLKIDACFVAGIDGPSNDHKIVRAVIALGHSLGLLVIAAGVETAEQLAVLEAEGCDLAQGRYLTPPSPPPTWRSTSRRTRRRTFNASADQGSTRGRARRGPEHPSPRSPLQGDRILTQAPRRTGGPRMAHPPDGIPRDVA